MLSTYHAMLQECGMKGLQNSFVATKSSSLSPNTCEGAANFALQSISTQKSVCGHASMLQRLMSTQTNVVRVFFTTSTSNKNAFSDSRTAFGCHSRAKCQVSVKSLGSQS